MYCYGTRLRGYSGSLLAALIACATLLTHTASAQYRMFDWGYNIGNFSIPQLGNLPINWTPPGSTSSLYGRGLPGQIRAFSNVIAVAVGDNHTLALKKDGTVWAWGDNGYGQLGTGTYAAGSDKPVQVVGLTGVTAIAAGGTHSIALKGDGTVYTWGDNIYGELCNNTSDNNAHPVPSKVTFLAARVTQIAAGAYHNEVLDSNNVVSLWGANGSGQLGDTTTKDWHTPVKVTQFANGAQIAAGGNNSMAQTQDGQVWVWGSINTSTPTAVPTLTGVTTLSTNRAGTFVVKSDGTLWNITTSGGLNAAQVPNISGVAVVSSANTYYNVTVALKDGTVWGVGYDTYGQLGDGTTNFASTGQWNWVQAARVNNAAQVQAGYQHTVALTKDNTVWSWGDNSYGQLAAVSPLHQSWPARTRLQIGSMMSAAIGDDGNGQAFFLMVKKNGDVWTWGSNSNGQLGNGGTTDSYTAPVQTYQFGSAVEVAASRNASSYAIKGDKTLWAWGNNAFGQLGDNTTTDIHSAKQVKGLPGITAVAPGTNHVIALGDDQMVYAWGNNSNGQLGDGTTTRHLTPVQVNNLSNVIAIAAGDSFNLALKSDHTVWTWGSNSYGMGDGTANPQKSPIQIKSLTNIVAIAAGYNHALALTQDGTVYAWGRNYEGELGNGTTNNSATPQQVSGLTGVKAISAGGNSSGGQSFAIKGDNTVWAWGYDYYGQLGEGIRTSGGYQHTPAQVILPGVARVLSNGNVTLALVKDPDPDFNSDSKTDLVWQNNVTGQHSAWYMNNNIWFGPYDELGPAIPTAWTLAGTADLNGDGQADMLWQNTQTGDVTVWYMQGAAYTGNWSYVAHGIPTQWKIVGTADLNGDGSPDLIWQNTQTGDVTVWYMNGSAYSGTWSYIAYGVPTQWKVVGTADVDGDGYADLIWANTQTGDVTVWYMKGILYTGNWDYLAKSIPTNWHVVSIQNLLGDSQPDLIWQNDAGDVVCWDMDVVQGWTGAWNYIRTGIPSQWSVIRAH